MYEDELFDESNDETTDIAAQILQLEAELKESEELREKLAGEDTEDCDYEKLIDLDQLIKETSQREEIKEAQAKKAEIKEAEAKKKEVEVPAEVNATNVYTFVSN